MKQKNKRLINGLRKNSKKSPKPRKTSGKDTEKHEVYWTRTFTPGSTSNILPQEK